MTDTLEHEAEVIDPAVIETPTDDQQGEPAELSDVEALAIEVGWKPADQWKGEGHMPAADYLKHQASRAKEKSDELKAVTKRMDRLAKTQASLMERQLQEQKEELESRYADMVAENKPAEARRIAKQIDQLEAADSPDELANDFKSRNAAWFEKDEAATALAVMTCEQLARQGKSYEEQLEAAEEKVRKRFPDLFGAKPETAPRRPPVVGAPSTRAAPARVKQYTLETLPPEAKAAMMRFKDKGVDPKRYLAEYNKEHGQ